MYTISVPNWSTYNKLCAYSSTELKKVFCKTATGFISEPISGQRLLILDLIWMIFKARSFSGQLSLGIRD